MPADRVYSVGVTGGGARGKPYPTPSPTNSSYSRKSLSPSATIPASSQIASVLSAVPQTSGVSGGTQTKKPKQVRVCPSRSRCAIPLPQEGAERLDVSSQTPVQATFTETKQDRCTNVEYRDWRNFVKEVRSWTPAQAVFFLQLELMCMNLLEYGDIYGPQSPASFESQKTAEQGPPFATDMPESRESADEIWPSLREGEEFLASEEFKFIFRTFGNEQ